MEKTGNIFIDAMSCKPIFLLVVFTPFLITLPGAIKAQLFIKEYNATHYCSQLDFMSRPYIIENCDWSVEVDLLDKRMGWGKYSKDVND